MLKLVKRIKVCVSGHTQVYMCENPISKAACGASAEGALRTACKQGLCLTSTDNQDSSVQHNRTLLVQAAEDFSSPFSKRGCLLAAHSFRLLATFLIASCEARGR